MPSQPRSGQATPGRSKTSNPTPDVRDTIKQDVLDENLGNYLALPAGTQHPDFVNNPEHRLLGEIPIDWETRARVYGKDRKAQQTYNGNVEYVNGSKDHPIYTRDFLIRRSEYRALDIKYLSPLNGLVRPTVTAEGSGYTQETVSVTLSGGVGSGGSVTAIVSNTGTIIGLAVLELGSYSIAPKVTITDSGTGTGAEGQVFLQRKDALLTDEKQLRMEGDPLDGLYVLIRRTYTTLPGPWVPTSKYDPFLGFVQGRRRLVVAGSYLGADFVPDPTLVASRTATAKTLYEAWEGNQNVSWQIEETNSDGTGSAGNPAFPIIARRPYDDERGPITGTEQIVVKASQVSSLTESGGTVTQKTYEPYDEFHYKEVIETWSVTGEARRFSPYVDARGTVSGTTQLVKDTGQTATLTESSGTVTETTYAIFSKIQLRRTVETWTSPGPILTDDFYEELRGGVEQTSQVIVATGSEVGSVVISSLTGGIAAIRLDTNGEGYTSTPTVGLTGGGGTGFTATAVLSSRSVNALTMGLNGTGYTTAPAVTISGGGGSGAAATAILQGTTLQILTRTAAGSGYSTDDEPAPIITISGGGGSGATATASYGVSAESFVLTIGTETYTVAPTATISGGGGSGATATVQLDGGGLITGITITDPGNSFTSAPTITFGVGTVLVPGTATTGVGNNDNFVVADDLTLTAFGSGYTSAPIVTITAPNGSGATATATLDATGVASLEITSGGDNYTSAPTVMIAPPFAGTTATATATITTAVVQDITITAAGTGYTTVPTVVFTGGGFSTAATATAVLGAYVLETKYEAFNQFLLRKIIEKWVLPGPTVTDPISYEDESGSRVTVRKTLRAAADIAHSNVVFGSALRSIERARSGISTIIGLEISTTTTQAVHYSYATARITTDMRPYQFPGRIDIPLLDYYGTAIGNKRAVALLTPHVTLTYWSNAATQPTVVLSEILPDTIWINNVRYENVLHDATSRTYSNSGGGTTVINFSATTPSNSTYVSSWIGQFKPVDGGVTAVRLYRWKVQITFVKMR